MSWYEEAVRIARIKSINPSFTIERVAIELGVSTGKVSESIMLVEAASSEESIIQLSRTEALNLIRYSKQQNKFKSIEDFKSTTILGSLDDIPDGIVGLCIAKGLVLGSKIYDKMASNSILFIIDEAFHFMANYNCLDRKGFKVDKVPIVWIRRDGETDDYKIITVAIKGYSLDKDKSSKIISCGPSFITISQILMRRVQDPNTIVLDPWATDSSVAIAAKRMNLKYLLVTQDRKVLENNVENITYPLINKAKEL